MTNLPVILRNPVESDFNFIINSWLKSYRNSAFATHIPNDVYFHAHSKIIKKTLEIGRVVVICSAEDNEQIMGYLVYEGRDNLFIMHFCYVKYPYRRLGLMRNAIEQVLNSNNQSGPIFITHLPRSFEELKQRYPYVYNPYLLEINS